MNELILIGTLLSVTLSGLLMFLLWRFKQKQLAQDETLNRIRVDFEQNLLNTRITLQEENFQKLAREIHDNIGMSLTVARLNLRLLDEPAKADQQSHYRTAAEQLDKAILDLKDLSRSMNPDIIKHLGFLRSVELELNALRKTGLYTVDFTVSGEQRPFAIEKEVILFRVIQEALHNILKHAEATAIQLNFDFRNDELNILISDNGIGFHTDTIDRKRKEQRSSGLFNMEERCQLLQGSFAITSEAGKGTSVYISIPLPQQKNDGTPGPAVGFARLPQ